MCASFITSVKWLIIHMIFCGLCARARVLVYALCECVCESVSRDIWCGIICLTPLLSPDTVIHACMHANVTGLAHTCDTSTLPIELISLVSYKHTHTHFNEFI